MESRNLRQATAGGVVLGVGLGGFFDGILLHQILQWHNMLSTVLPPNNMEAVQTNIRWDGFFHAVVWIATVAGVLLLWTGARRAHPLPSTYWVIGLMLIGWGAFNFVEGLVDHHILGIHHVREWGPNPAWDFGFLMSGPILVGFGWLISRSATHSRSSD